MYSFKQICNLLEEFEQVSGRLGSNEGGIFMDKKTNQKAYIKFPRNPEQAKVEVATSKIYDKMGIKTFHPSLHHLGEKVGVKTKWHEGMSVMGHPDDREFTEDHAKQLATMLHGAVITGNYDVVGLEHDNILHDGKHYYSVDQGGSMHFRAQGAGKPFEKRIDEVSSFKNPEYTTGQLYHSITKPFPRVMHDTVDSVKSLKDSDIDQIMDDTGLDRKHGDVVKARRDLLLRHYGRE